MEASGYVEALTGELDEHGHRLVVRNGHAEPRPSSPPPAGSRSKRPEWTTAGWTPRPATDAGSARPSSRHGVARARRWPRCCR
jgi:hypothetical protein